MDSEKLIYTLKNPEAGFPRWKVLEKFAPGIAEEYAYAHKQAKDFGKRFIEPSALELDRKIEKDAAYFPWDIVHHALPYRFLSCLIPKPFGGMGFSISAYAVFLEELCSYCAGIANIFGAHSLGMAPMFLAPDIRHYEKHMREVARSEKEGKPVLFALAITEPDAGSDVEDEDFLKTARLGTVARKVQDGYVLNGRKVFISNGSVAAYVWVGAVLDRNNPLDTSVSFVVKTSAKGFSVGKIEKKLGQRACPAAELIFEDLFVPEEDRVGEEGEGKRLIGLVLGASRGPVAAIATGIARGAFERLLSYLNQTKRNGRYLFEEQWCQLMLVEMMGKIQMARQMYLDATMLCDFTGLPKLLYTPYMKALNQLPAFFFESSFARRIFLSRKTYQFVRKIASRAVQDEDIKRIAAYSSLAKCFASDLAMEVTSKALEVMGEDGPVSEYGIEKLYRDAKLCQIYEGTNQINKLYAFKNSLAAF